MAKSTTYYHIRTIKAKNQNEALECVENGYFDEENDLCDKVLTAEELIRELLMQLEQLKKG